MKIQVLIATMHQKQGDYSLLDKMNIQSDAIVCNQCDRYEAEEFDYNGHKIKWFSFAERGVGLNRNNALMRADADIILFADDDVQYVDGYPQILEKTYLKNPKADLIIMNVSKKRGNSPFVDCVKKSGRLHKSQATKYGTYCVSAKTDSVRFANVSFHRDFGGGTKYSCGEDTLFIRECIKSGLRAYTSVDKIGSVDHGDSTWFSGHNDKFFIDKGVLYYAMDHFACRFYALYHCIKHRHNYEDYGCLKAYKMMLKGIKSVAKRG